jgi:thiol-disulfide isomerase/thioredoxin
MKRNQAILLFTFVLLMHAAVGQQNARIEVRSALKEIASAEAFIDNSYLRIKPRKFGASRQEGAFVFQLPLDRNCIIELFAGPVRFPIYIQPGDDLILQISGTDKMELSLSGSAAKENEFLQRFFGKFPDAFNDSLNQSKMLALTPDQFETFIFGMRKEQQTFLKEDQEFSVFRPEFRNFVESQIKYNYWALLLNYPIARANSSTSILTVEPLPEIMLDGLQDLSLNDERALISDTYRNFLKYYNIYFTSKANSFKKFTDYSTSADKKMAMAKDKFDTAIYTYWLARFTADECGRLAPFMVKKMLSELKELDKASVFYPVVTEYCESLPVTLADGPDAGDKKEKAKTASAELDLKDVNGKSVQLSDFKGKVVYIDFWASWCGPCRVMMPFSKKLHEQMTEKEKKQIVFLYISIDADKNAWIKGIKDMDIQGVNVISPGNWKSQACRYFQINGIPRYMIMNKKGEIVDTNAKRPADHTVLDDLRKYLAD